MTQISNLFDPSEVVLSTIHGSNLYGLNHAKSDTDLYLVLSDATGSTSPTQIISGEHDHLIIGFSNFMKQVYKGVPQALEAFYSPKAEVDKLHALRSNYYCNSSKVVNTYLRTIKSFSLDDRHPTKYKKHAIRLAFNLNSIVTQGYFSPVLSEEQKTICHSVENLTSDEYYDTLILHSLIRPTF